MRTIAIFLFVATVVANIAKYYLIYEANKKKKLQKLQEEQESISIRIEKVGANNYYVKDVAANRWLRVQAFTQYILWTDTRAYAEQFCSELGARKFIDKYLRQEKTGEIL